jgi:hypothetical protein
MGRPLNPRYLGPNAPRQIQALVYGVADSVATPGYLAGQNSPTRFRTTTVNGTSLTALANGPTPTNGQCVVKVFPVNGYVTAFATANATLGVTGNANVINGGSGYAVNDYITINGGTFGNAANIQVLAVNSGKITKLSAPVNAVGNQKYTALPANIAGMSTTASTGTGTGAVIQAHFGLDTSYITGGGAGYTAPNVTVTYETRVYGTQKATVTNPVTSAGAVTLGQLTVLTPGILDAIPTVTVENVSQSVVEYAKKIYAHYLTCFSGSVYKWHSRGLVFYPDYVTLGVKFAYLDTV